MLCLNYYSIIKTQAFELQWEMDNSQMGQNNYLFQIKVSICVILKIVEASIMRAKACDFLQPVLNHSIIDLPIKISRQSSAIHPEPFMKVYSRVSPVYETFKIFHFDTSFHTTHNGVGRTIRFINYTGTYRPADNIDRCQSGAYRRKLAARALSKKKINGSVAMNYFITFTRPILAHYVCRQRLHALYYIQIFLLFCMIYV